MASHRLSQRFDEHRWVIQIRQTLGEDIEDDTDLPVSIFDVPKALKSSSPEVYAPQQVAIGPYHHFRPELHDMERYKVAAAKRVQRIHQQLGDQKFQNLVENLAKVDGRVRSCYHKYIDLNIETLGWMMAIDASFLLEYLQVYATKDIRALVRISSSMSHLVDYAKRKSAHNAILKDIVMLENQIPMFILRKVLEFQICSSPEESNDTLDSMLMGFCKELCPFLTMKELPKVKASESTHLLDFLYRIIVPAKELQSSEIIEEDHDEAGSTKPESNKSCLDHVKQLPEDFCKMLSKLNRGPIWSILKLPWPIISNLPGISILKQPIEYLFFSETTLGEKAENNNPNDLTLVEEIAIPSVMELSQAGVHFIPTDGNLSSIAFDPKADTFYLPAIRLDINSEVIMRNIVAYEAANASGPLVFTRYTELMNGIIDTEGDAKFLREQGIIVNHLKSDQEVADLWNGMSKSIQLTKVPFLDKTIEDVNTYYHSRWKIKIAKVLKNYVFGSWQCLAFLAAIMILLLLTVQAFCSLYSYARMFRINNTTS